MFGVLFFWVFVFMGGVTLLRLLFVAGYRGCARVEKQDRVIF